MQNPVVVLGIPNSWPEERVGGTRLRVKQSTFSIEQPVLSNHGVARLSRLLLWKLCLLGEGGSAPAVSPVQGQPLEVQMLLLSPLLLSLSPALGSPSTARAWGTRGPPDQHSGVWGPEVGGQHGGVSLPPALCAQKESTSSGQNKENVVVLLQY